MRQLASFLLALLAVPAVAAEIWRWKDANGVIRFSDRPVPGAERVDLPADRPSTGPSISPQAAQAPAAPAPPARFVYTQCTIEAPGNDQVFNAVDSVTASVQISPQLQPEHQLQVLLDGVAHGAWPPRMLTFRIAGIERGTHSLRALVVDAAKQPLCEGPEIRFHVRQPSLLSPARPQPPARP